MSCCDRWPNTCRRRQQHCNVVLPGIGAELVGATDGELLAVRGLVIGARPAPTFLAPVAIRGELAWIGLQEILGDLDAAGRRS